MLKRIVTVHRDEGLNKWNNVRKNRDWHFFCFLKMVALLFQRVPLMLEKGIVVLIGEVLKMYSSSGINIYTALLFEFKENSLMVNEPKE